MSEDLIYSTGKFEKAIMRLKESYALPKDSVVRDSCAKRFEFCVELAWKTMKLFLNENHGVNVQSPKSCVREAFHLGLINYENTWLEIIDWRNDLAHGYEESYAEKVYDNLEKVIDLFEALLKKIKAQ